MKSEPDAAPDLKLGLIGDNIARSRSPLLHRLAGSQCGLSVRYDRLIPVDLGQSFEDVFHRCAAEGYRGINITYPYKERAASFVTIEDPLVRRIGAVNTVLFEANGPRGYNTDYTGFMAAYRAARGEAAPGDTLVIGAGGVGRAIVFALVALGATRLRLVDRDAAKCDALIEDLQRTGTACEFSLWLNAEAAAQGASGLVNCTPVGMVGHEGTPLGAKVMRGASWAFDAVYTPVQTRFLVDAAAQGLAVISGWELFFNQGVDAWKRFSGRSVDLADLRHELVETGEAA